PDRRGSATLAMVVSIVAAACGPASTPSAAPTAASAGGGAAQPTSVAAKPTTAPVQPTAATAANPTAAPAQINNAPKSAQEVDQISLQGKNVEVTYWHNRPQQDQDLLQSMLDDFNKTNPYGIVAHAENAGAGYPDVYNKVNAAIQAGQPPEMSVAYQNQAAFYRAQNTGVALTPFVKSTKYGLSQDDLKDYYQAFLDSDQNPQFSGERLGFPTQRSMDVMYYNADWLKQIGVDGPPKDWKAWEDAACKASDGQNKYGWAVQH